MNLFLIVLSLIFFHGNSISGADDTELEAIDVVSTLKTSSPDCDLRTFVKHNEDYTAFVSDLKTYCSSDSKKQNRLLCNMLAYELKKACRSDKSGRPSPVIYLRKSTPKEICFPSSIKATSEWILNALTKNGQKQIDVTADDLCQKVTNDETTFQLAKFFYRAAPHVRNADLAKTSKDGTKSNQSKQTLTDAKDAVVGAATTVKNKTKNIISDAKDDADQAVETAKAKINETAKALKKTLTDGAEDVKSEAGQVVKPKADKTTDDTKEKVDKTISDGKDKDEDAAETGKSKVGAVGGPTKEKGNKATEKLKQKADDNDDDDNDAGVKTKAKPDNDDNDDADKDKTGGKKKKTDEDADSAKDKFTDLKKLSKDVGNKLTNVTKAIAGNGKELLNRLTNRTGTIGKNTDEQGQVLDLKQDKKADKNAADDGDDEEEKDDDDKGDGKAKDDGQAKQIPKPGTVDKKEKKKPVDAGKDDGADPDDDDKDDETQHKVDDMDKKDQQGNNEPVSRDDYDAANTSADQNQLENVPNNDEDEEYQAGKKDDDNDGISFRKPNANDKYTPKPVVADPNKGKARPKPQVGRKYSDDDGWSGSFVTYFLLFTLFVVVGYLVLHNKNKVLGLLIEGCRRNRSANGRRNGSSSSSTRYQRLSQSS